MEVTTWRRLGWQKTGKSVVVGSEIVGGFIYDYLINHTFNEQSISGIVLWILLVTSQEKNSFNEVKDIYQSHALYVVLFKSSNWQITDKSVLHLSQTHSMGMTIEYKTVLSSINGYTYLFKFKVGQRSDCVYFPPVTLVRQLESVFTLSRPWVPNPCLICRVLLIVPLTSRLPSTTTRVTLS